MYRSKKDLLWNIRLRSPRDPRGEIIRLVRRSMVFGGTDILAPDRESALLSYKSQVDNEEDPKSKI